MTLPRMCAQQFWVFYTYAFYRHVVLNCKHGLIHITHTLCNNSHLLYCDRHIVKQWRMRCEWLSFIHKCSLWGDCVTWGSRLILIQSSRTVCPFTLLVCLGTQVIDDIPWYESQRYSKSEFGRIIQLALFTVSGDWRCLTMLAIPEGR